MMAEDRILLTPDDPGFYDGAQDVVKKRIDAYLGSVGEKYQAAEESLYDDWQRTKYERPVPSPEEWLNSDEWMGATGCKTFPLVKEEFYRVMATDPRPMMLVLMGGIGWGKTFFSCLTMAYLITELSCLRSPQAYHGLALNSRIVLMNMSVTKGHAKRVMFMQLMAMMDDSPYFRDVFPRYMATSSILTWPQKKITFLPGSSSELAPLGENLFGGVIEEANAFPVIHGSRKSQNPEEEYDAAQTLKDSIWRRMQSRYQKMGRVPGMLVMNSSSKYPDDFLERMVKESDPREVMTIRHAEWETKPKDRYCGKLFYMFVGDVQTMPRIIDDKGERETIKNEGGELLEIPAEYRAAFEKDPVGALRDIAGRTVRAYDRFIQDDARLDAMFEAGKFMPRAFHNRFEQGVSSDELQTAVHPVNLIRKELRMHPQEAPVAMLHPEALRYCHIDLSAVSDATGFAIAHVGEVKEVERLLDGPDGMKEVTREMVPIVYVDVALKIIPPEKGEIEFATIRELIHRFGEEAGFTFAKITFDAWQSRDSQQILRKRFGDDVVKPLSLDRTPDAYVVFKEAVYERRVVCPFYAPLSAELRQLRRSQKTGKVDHLPKGSKDVADAVAGAVFGAVREFDSSVGFEMSLGQFEDEIKDLTPEDQLTAWLMGVGPKPESEAEEKPKTRTEVAVERVK